MVGRIVILLLLSAALGGKAWAVTWFVPSECPTIRAGIDSANVGDTVLVACGTYYEYDIVIKPGICLRSETGTRECATIDAESEGRVLLCEDGSDTVRVEGFTFTHGLAARGGGTYCRNSLLSFVECDFSENRSSSSAAGSGLGGAICSDSCSVVLTDCAFRGNVASSSERDAAWGGAIYCSGSSLVLDACTLSHNSADGWYPDAGLGGGVYAARSSVSISCCAFDRNEGVSGGGIYCDGDCNADLSDCSLSGNSAYGYDIFDGYGGGLHINGDVSSTTLVGCTFSDNGATGGGGALHGTAAATGCRFLGNGSLKGGAIDGGGPLTRCVFYGNSASTGGAVHKNQDSSPITNCTFAGNSASYGAALYCDRTSPEVRNTIIAFNSIGTAIQCAHGTSNPALIHCDVYGNSVGDSLGCQFVIESTIRENPLFCDLTQGELTLCALSPCLPASNNWGQLIGALDTGDCECRGHRTLTVPGDYATITGALQEAAFDDTVLVYPGTYFEAISLPRGVVLRSWGGSDSTTVDGQGEVTPVTMQGLSKEVLLGTLPWATFEGFTVTGGAEWGMLITDCDPLVRGCQITGNRGTGGGIRCTHGSPRIVDCTLSSNGTEQGAQGGGLHCRFFSAAEVESCAFCSNTAGYGAGIHVSDSSAKIKDCTLVGNTAESQGGGVYCYRSELTITNCVLSSNSAREGGGVCTAASDPVVTGCTLLRNVAEQGAGMYFCTTTHSVCYPSVSHCTLFANESSAGAAVSCEGLAWATLQNTVVSATVGGNAVHCDETGEATLRCCDVFANAAGDWVECIDDQYGVNGNISADPLFCDPAGADFHLDENSPCAPGNAGVCGLIGALGIACAHAPAALTLSVLQDPYLTQHLDIRLTSSAELDTASIVLRVGAEGVDIRRVGDEEYIWAGSYELTGAVDSMTIHCCASDTWGNDASTTMQFSAAHVRAAQGGVVTSSDRRVRMIVDADALMRNAFVLIFRGEEASPTHGALTFPTGNGPTAGLPSSCSAWPSYTVSPRGILRTPRCVLMFLYNQEDLGGEEPTRLYVEEQSGELLQSFVDPEARTVTVPAKEFGTFRLALGSEGSSHIVDPQFLRLEQNVPNPFGTSTTIRFEVRFRQRVRISVYDVVGRRVAQLLDRILYPGPDEVVWNGTREGGGRAAAGVYFCRVQSEGGVSTTKMLLIR